ncbi:MAG: S1/P1 nuclease [Pseudomonadota bacterium]
MRRIAFCVAVLLPCSALAWGPVGHRLVARLAETRLHPQTRAEVARLLRSEADPTLAGVANWADDLRDNPDAGDPDLGRRTSRWHYVNLAEDDCAYRPPAHCPNGDCVIEAIIGQRALLADRRQPDAVRAQALKFLVHLVGDAHQPLHAGYARDKGGNTVQLQVGGKGSNLHRVWDSEVLASAGLSEPKYFARLQRRPPPLQPSGPTRDPGAWAEASCRIVLRDGFYPARTTLDPGYFAHWRPTAELQLRIAGFRLAALLNDTLDAPGTP